MRSSGVLLLIQRREYLCFLSKLLPEVLLPCCWECKVLILDLCKDQMYE